MRLRLRLRLCGLRETFLGLSCFGNFCPCALTACQTDGGFGLLIASDPI